MPAIHIDRDAYYLLRELSSGPRSTQGRPEAAVNFVLTHGLAEPVAGTDRLQITAAGKPYGQRITSKGNG